MKSVTPNINTIAPSERLLAQVRGALITQGTSLNKWCKEHGIDRAWASDALKGKRNGPKAKALRTKIFREVILNAP